MNTEKIIPVGEFILISLETEDTQENQLILNIQEDIENKGVVKAVGEKVNTDEYSIKIEKGDKIIFTPGTGIKITNSDDSDILISVKHVVGIIKGE